MSEKRPIVEWSRTHPRWSECLAVVTDEGQTDWLAFRAPWHQSERILVALHHDTVIGFLRFVVQSIGEEDEHVLATLDGATLTERLTAFLT